MIAPGSTSAGNLDLTPFYARPSTGAELKGGLASSLEQIATMVRVVRYDDDGLISAQFQASGQELTAEGIVLVAPQSPRVGERLTIDLSEATASARRLIAEVLDAKPSVSGDCEQFEILCRFLSRIDGI